MTSSAFRLKWIVHLALVLVYQTARLVEGHPYAPPEVPSNAFVKVPPNAGSPSSQDTSSSVSRLIEAAYTNHELLEPRQLTQRTDDEVDQGSRRMQWDTSKQQESSSDGMMQYRKRQLLQVSNPDVSIYRNPEVSMHRSAGVSHRNSDEKIIFPDGRTSTSPRTMMPALGCHKSTFCENVAGYPRQLVNAAIARNASLRFLEIIDPMPDVTDITEQRIDVTDIDVTESSLCQIREQVVYPQTAQNKEKQWLFIVNQDDLKQGIRIEICLNEGRECNMIVGFAEGYKTTCKQKYIHRELAAVGSDGNIFKDQFRFPSSCCCHVKFTGDPTVRLGLGRDLPTNRTQYK